MHTHTNTHIHIHMHTYLHTRMRTHTRKHTHTNTRTHMHTNTRTQTHAHKYTHTHKHTHTHAHIHTQCHVSCIPVYSGIKPRHRKPRNFFIIAVIAQLSCLVVYSFVGIFGYLTFLPKECVNSDILRNYCPNNPDVSAARTLLAICLITSYPILYFCGRWDRGSLIIVILHFIGSQNFASVCLYVCMYVCMSVLYLQAFNWQCYNEIHITCSMLPHLEVQTLASPAQTTSVVPSAGALEGVAWSCDMDGAVDTSGIVCSTDKICDQSHGLPSWAVYPCLPWWEVWSLWEMHCFVLSLLPDIIHVRSMNNICQSMYTLHDSYLNFTLSSNKVDYIMCNGKKSSSSCTVYISCRVLV